jgi:hypothetical protein
MQKGGRWLSRYLTGENLVDIVDIREGGKISLNIRTEDRTHGKEA